MSTAEPSVTQAVHEAQRATVAGDLDRRWDLVSHLHTHGGREALDAATRLRADPAPSRRALAADILGQLGSGPGQPAINGPYREDALTLLLSMLDDEHDPLVLHAITVGFGHIGDARCVDPLVRLSTHPDAEVRSGVVFGLLGRPEPAALDALIPLSADTEAQVRDWATFGLARQTTQDFPRLRDALADRLADDDPDTRAEAIHGLAVRGDPRATEPLLTALETPTPYSDDYIIAEALYALAEATADPRLHHHLLVERDRLADPPEGLLAALARYATTEKP